METLQQRTVGMSFYLSDLKQFNKLQASGSRCFICLFPWPFKFEFVSCFKHICSTSGQVEVGQTDCIVANGMIPLLVGGKILDRRAKCLTQ